MTTGANGEANFFLRFFLQFSIFLPKKIVVALDRAARHRAHYSLQQFVGGSPGDFRYGKNISAPDTSYRRGSSQAKPAENCT
jgi:hypothetical protein